MRLSGKRILRTPLHLMARFGRTFLAQECASDEPPLRSELFSSDQMRRHGKALADSHKLSLKRPSERLLTRLTENEGVLMGARNHLTEAIKANRRIGRASRCTIGIERQSTTSLSYKHAPRIVRCV